MRSSSLCGCKFVVVVPFVVFLVYTSLSVWIKPSSLPTPTNYSEPQPDKNFYLSIVVAARDDDYGGNFVGRLNNSINYLGKLCDENRFAIEYIIIEWNPLPNRTIANKLSKIYQYLTLRIITVPQSVHMLTENYNAFPVQEYMGKNVGIRRARGEYVLSTNPDIVFSRSLVEYWAQKKLQRRQFYRIKLMYTRTVPACVQLSEYEIFLRTNLLHAVGYGPIANDSVRLEFWKKFDAVDCKRILEISTNQHSKINGNAAGDFLLMAKDQWFFIKGHPERGFSTHLDFIICHAMGSCYNQTTLLPPFAIYHQEHSHQPRTAALPWDKVKRTVEDLINDKSVPTFTNNDTWGWSYHNFEEISL